MYFSTLPVIAAVSARATALAPTWSSDADRALLLLFGLAGVSIALLVPALAWASALAGTQLRAASLFHRAFMLNLLQATLFVSVYKAFAGSVPSRTAFIAWQALIAASGLGVLARARVRSTVAPLDNVRPALTGVLVILLVLPAFLWGKIFVEDGSGDGIEAFEFARSLATHQLPYWDLENGYYGFYPQFMLFAYPAQLACIAIGETEAAVRLPVFFYLLGIYLVSVELVRAGRRRLSWAEISLLLTAAVFFVIYHAYHSTYEVVSDLAEPFGVDTFFTFMAASAFYALLTRQRVWWSVFAVSGTMALAAGLPFALFFLLGRVFAKPPSVRWSSLRSHVLDGAAFFAPWLAYQLFVVVYAHFYPLGVMKWSFDTLFEQYPLQLASTIAVGVVTKFATVVGFVPLVALFMAHRDKVIRMLVVPVVGYFLLLIPFARIHPHYLIPLSLFPAAMLLRTLAAPRRLTHRMRVLGHVVYGAALATLCFAVLPEQRAPHTAYREFGARTLMRYDSYPAVVAAVEQLLEDRPELWIHLPVGKVALPWEQFEFEVSDGMAPPERSFDQAVSLRSALEPSAALLGLSTHLWIRYSDRQPVTGHEYLQVLSTTALAPQQLPGFSRRELTDGWVLFSRTREFASASGAPPAPPASLTAIQ